MIPTLYKEVLQELANGKKLKVVMQKRNMDYKKTYNELTSLRKVLNARTTNHMIAIMIREGMIQ